MPPSSVALATLVISLATTVDAEPTLRRQSITPSISQLRGGLSLTEHVTPTLGMLTTNALLTRDLPMVQRVHDGADAGDFDPMPTFVVCLTCFMYSLLSAPAWLTEFAAAPCELLTTR